MEPQSWLDVFVRRNLAEFARFRNYVEAALAATIADERKKRPRPEHIPGEVLGMGVRDRILLQVGNPAFLSGGLIPFAKPNRGVGLRERATGVEVSVRKVFESGTAPDEGADSSQVIVGAFVQDSLVPEEGPNLAEGLGVMIIWAVGADDLLADCQIVVYQGAKGSFDPNRVTLRAVTGIPPLEAISSGTLPGVVVSPEDDFGQLVARRGSQTARGSGETSG